MSPQFRVALPRNNVKTVRFSAVSLEWSPPTSQSIPPPPPQPLESNPGYFVLPGEHDDILAADQPVHVIPRGPLCPPRNLGSSTAALHSAARRHLQSNTDSFSEDGFFLNENR